MRFTMRLRALFGKIVHDGISSVPKAWFDREKNSSTCKLLDLYLENGAPVEVRKLPYPKHARDYFNKGDTLQADPLSLHALTGDLLKNTGNYEVHFELSGVAIVDRIIPSLLGWAALKYEAQLEIYPEEGLLFRIRPANSR